jgi:hypothetical protein
LHFARKHVSVRFAANIAVLRRGNMLDLLAKTRTAIHKQLDRIPQGNTDLGVLEKRLLCAFDKADGALGDLIDEITELNNCHKYLAKST